MGGHRGGGERLPILPCYLQDNPAGLSPGSPWGINVPSPIADGEHVFGHPLCHSLLGIYHQESTPMISCSTTHVATTPPQELNNNTICPIRQHLCHSQETKLLGVLKSHPIRNKRTRHLLRNPCKGVAEKLLPKTQI